MDKEEKAAYMREWRRKNPGKNKEYYNNLVSKNPDKISEYNHRQYLRRKAMKGGGDNG